MRIAIIGAGLAGLVAARRLGAAGRAVTLFEKSGGRGGRIATRRDGDAAFDHGAPLVHGLDADLARAAGGAAWRDGIVGRPGNSSLGRALAVGLDIRDRTRVTGLASDASGWHLALAARPGTASPETAGPFAAVLLAIPAPQARDLLGRQAAAFAGLGSVAMAPGLTMMARFAAAFPGPAWRDDLQAPLGLALRDTAKPGRPPGEAWVIHADPAFAAAALEAPPQETGARLLTAFRAASGAGEPLATQVHRWRYARTTRPLGAPCLWSPALALGLAGDWCLGADAGCAAASGAALADAVLAAA